ncbi:ataxin-2-like protein isoform X2 [Varroa jacobsoni]|uniref:ataxin-2-like protein isoform X2 n=1 Tax=Varroa jacobsoni TaxID=62625 RepID=UPI000BF3EC00|nr:ataxin-2-like protein isoform X2 [Varroa jacobsoni]
MHARAPGSTSHRARNQRSGGKNASSDRTPVVDKGLSTATNSVQPSFLGPRSISATTGSSNSIISNNNNNNNAAAAAISNLNNSTSSNDASGGSGGTSATRNLEAGGASIGRDRGDGPASGTTQQQTASSTATTAAGSATLGGSSIVSANSVGPGSPRDGVFVAPGLAGLAQGPDGVYNNARFMHAVAALVGHTVEVRVRGEKEIYEGLFYTLSPELQIVLDGVLIDSPDRERSSPDGRGGLPLDSAAAAAQSAPGHLAGLVRNMERLKNADPSHQPLQETMVFSLQDVISVTAYNIDMDYATKDNAFTDAAISRGANGRPIERDLQAWMDDEPEGKSVEEGQLEDMSAATSWDPEEMFKTNKSKFGVETTYRENLEGYTYQYEQRNDDPEFQRREAEAVRIAMEIESNVQHKRNNELEIGCDGDDEELKYSAVVKESKNDSRSSYVHSGGRRNKQGAPNANGGQSKGGSQQRGGTSHPTHHTSGNPNTRGGHTRLSPTNSPAPHVPLPVLHPTQVVVAAAGGGQPRPPQPIKDEGRRGTNERSSPAARTSPPPKVQPTQQQQQQQQQQQEKLQDKQREDKGPPPAGVGHNALLTQPPTQQQQQRSTPPPSLQQQQQHVAASAHVLHEGKRTPPLATITATPCIPATSSQPPQAGQQQPLQSAGQQPMGGASATSPAEAVKADSVTSNQQPPQTPSPAPASQSTSAVSTSTDEIVKKSTLNPNAAEFVFNPKTTHVTQTTVTHSKQSTPPAQVMHAGGHPTPNRPIMVPQHLILPGTPVFSTFQAHSPGHVPPTHGHGGAHQPGGAGAHQGGRNHQYRGNKGGNNRQAVDQTTMHVTGAPLVTGGPQTHQQVVLGYPPPHYGPAPPGGVPPVTVMQPQIAMQHGQQVQVLNYNQIVQTRGVMSPPAGPGVGGVGSPSMVGPIHQGEYPAALHIAGHPQQVFLRDQPTQLLYQQFEGAPGQALAFVVQPQPPGGGGQSGAPTPPTGGVGGPHGGPHGQQPLLAYPGQPQWGQPMLLAMSPINPSSGAPTGTPPPHHGPHMNMAVMPPLGPHSGPHGQHAPTHGPPFPQAVVQPGVPVPPNAMPVQPGGSVVGGPPSAPVTGAPTGQSNQQQQPPTGGAQQGPPPLPASQQPQQPPPQPPGYSRLVGRSESGNGTKQQQQQQQQQQQNRQQSLNQQQ